MTTGTDTLMRLSSAVSKNVCVSPPDSPDRHTEHVIDKYHRPHAGHRGAPLLGLFHKTGILLFSMAVGTEHHCQPTQLINRTIQVSRHKNTR